MPCMTRIACDLAKHFGDVATHPMLSMETKQWWGQHQKEDAEREARRIAAQTREQIKQQVLQKLTPEEREVLKL